MSACQVFDNLNALCLDVRRPGKEASQVWWRPHQILGSQESYWLFNV